MYHLPLMIRALLAIQSNEKTGMSNGGHKMSNLDNNMQLVTICSMQPVNFELRLKDVFQNMSYILFPFTIKF